MTSWGPPYNDGIGYGQNRRAQSHRDRPTIDRRDQQSSSNDVFQQHVDGWSRDKSKGMDDFDSNPQQPNLWIDSEENQQNSLVDTSDQERHPSISDASTERQHWNSSKEFQRTESPGSGHTNSWAEYRGQPQTWRNDFLRPHSDDSQRPHSDDSQRPQSVNFYQQFHGDLGVSTGHATETTSELSDGSVINAEFLDKNRHLVESLLKGKDSILSVQQLNKAGGGSSFEGGPEDNGKLSASTFETKGPSPASAELSYIGETDEEKLKRKECGKNRWQEERDRILREWENQEAGNEERERIIREWERQEGGGDGVFDGQVVDHGGVMDMDIDEEVEERSAGVLAEEMEAQRRSFVEREKEEERKRQEAWNKELEEKEQKQRSLQAEWDKEMEEEKDEEEEEGEEEEEDETERARRARWKAAWEAEKDVLRRARNRAGVKRKRTEKRRKKAAVAVETEALAEEMRLFREQQLRILDDALGKRNRSRSSSSSGTESGDSDGSRSRSRSSKSQNAASETTTTSDRERSSSHPKDKFEAIIAGKEREIVAQQNPGVDSSSAARRLNDIRVQVKLDSLKKPQKPVVSDAEKERKRKKEEEIRENIARLQEKNKRMYRERRDAKQYWIEIQKTRERLEQPNRHDYGGGQGGGGGGNFGADCGGVGTNAAPFEQDSWSCPVQGYYVESPPRDYNDESTHSHQFSPPPNSTSQQLHQDAWHMPMTYSEQGQNSISQQIPHQGSQQMPHQGSQQIPHQDSQQIPHQGSQQMPHQGSQLPREWRAPESDSQMQNRGFNETQTKAEGREGCLKNFEKTWLSMAVSGSAPTVSKNPPSSSASIAFNSADVIPNSNYSPSQDLCAERTTDEQTLTAREQAPSQISLAPQDSEPGTSGASSTEVPLQDLLHKVLNRLDELPSNAGNQGSSQAQLQGLLQKLLNDDITVSGNSSMSSKVSESTKVAHASNSQESQLDSKLTKNQLKKLKKRKKILAYLAQQNDSEGNAQSSRTIEGNSSNPAAAQQTSTQSRSSTAAQKSSITLSSSSNDWPLSSTPAPQSGATTSKVQNRRKRKTIGDQCTLRDAWNSIWLSSMNQDETGEKRRKFNEILTSDEDAISSRSPKPIELQPKNQTIDSMLEDIDRSGVVKIPRDADGEPNEWVRRAVAGRGAWKLSGEPQEATVDLVKSWSMNQRESHAVAGVSGTSLNRKSVETPSQHLDLEEPGSVVGSLATVKQEVVDQSYNLGVHEQGQNEKLKQEPTNDNSYIPTQSRFETVETILERFETGETVVVPRLEDGSPNEALMKEIADRWVSDNRVPPNLAKAWYMRGQYLPKAKAYIVKNHAKSMRKIARKFFVAAGYQRDLVDSIVEQQIERENLGTSSPQKPLTQPPPKLP